MLSGSVRTNLLMSVSNSLYRVSIVEPICALSNLFIGHIPNQQISLHKVFDFFTIIRIITNSHRRFYVTHI